MPGGNFQLSLTAASASGTGIAAESYHYDHQDRRIETVTNGTPKRFVYAGQELLSEYGADWSAAQAHYAYAGLDHPLLRNTPSGNAYYHADGLGSVVATSNAVGSITASARYDAFGQTINKTGAIPRYGYAGREPDQTGLIYYRARYYDPGLGRFGQRDPAGFADGINPYAYVSNNPISFSDPLGLVKSVPIPGSSVSSYPGSGRFNSIVNEFKTTAGAFKDAVVAKPALQAFAVGSTVGAGVGVATAYPVATALTLSSLELASIASGDIPLGLSGLANPSSIRFTQSSISATFKDGAPIQNTIDALRSGALSPSAIQPIRVFEHNSSIYTLDNRRLFVSSQAGVPVNITPASPAEVAGEWWKFTTPNNGCIVCVKRGSVE